MRGGQANIEADANDISGGENERRGAGGAGEAEEGFGIWRFGVGGRLRRRKGTERAVKGTFTYVMVRKVSLPILEHQRSSARIIACPPRVQLPIHSARAWDSPREDFVTTAPCMRNLGYTQRAVRGRLC